MASIFSKRIAALCAATLVGATANAAATYTTEDDGATLVVTVDAAGATLDADQIVAGVTKIVKRGPGKLTATPIPSYTGNFDFEEGIFCSLAAGDFGATSTTAHSGMIEVRDGASIEYAGTATNPRSLEGKTVNLYGAAAEGAEGKIFLSNKDTQMGGWQGGLGLTTKYYLCDSDTTFWSRARLAICGTFDLGGHVLTLDGGNSRAVDLGGTITNGGAVVVTSWTIWITQSTGLKFAPDRAANSYIEIQPNATFNIKDKRTYANGWTIRNNGGAITCNTQINPDSSDIGVWEGPIVLSGSASLANYGAKIGGWGISNTVVNVAGPLSGEGTLLVGPGWLNLRHADNIYSGPVTVRGKGTKRTAGNNENVVPPGAGGIGVWNGASVFTNASSITLKDSARVEFMDDIAASVGALKFVGDTSTFTNGDPGDDTQSITGGSATSRSTIAGLTKTGTNTLVVGTTAHFTGTATISNGVLKIPYRSIKGTPGLYETHVTQKSSDDSYARYVFSSDDGWHFCKPWDDNYVAHLNFTETGVNAIGAERAYLSRLNGNSKASGERTAWGEGTNTRNGWWYHGYVWNHSDEAVTWKVWSGVTRGVCIWLGEGHETVYEISPYFASPHNMVGHSVDLTLQPGATRIDIFIWSLGNDLWCREIPSSAIRYGLSYTDDAEWTAAEFNAEIDKFYAEPSPAQTNVVKAMAAKFKEFSDGGTASLFTADVYGVNDGDKKVALLPVFDDLRFENGTKLDLDGNLDFCVKDLVGSPTVENAVRFTVTNNWTICAADFPKSDSSVRNVMTVDGKLVFAEGATFSVDDENAIARSQSGIVVATATDGIVGRPKAAPSLTRKWKLRIDGNVAKLIDSSGLIVVIR